MSSSIRIGNGGFAPAPLNPYTISGAMSVGDAVYLVPGSALTVARADANDAAKRPPIGIVAGISGSTAQVAGSGAVASGLSGLTVGSVYYLDTSPGGITTTVPASDIYILGVAISTSQILVGTVPKDLVGGGGGASSLQDAYDNGATITTASSTDLAFTLSSGGFKVNGSGTVDIGATGTDVTSFNVGAGSVDVQATGAVTIDSSGGAISIGSDADAQPINVGTGAAARKVTVGNVTGATEVEVNTGTVGFDVNALGPITLDGVGGSNLTTSSGNLTLATTTSGTVAVSSAGNLTFVDQYRASSTFSGAISFSAASSEWDSFELNFGEVSLLAAINSAKSGPTGGTSGQVLTSNGAGAPTFQSVPYDVSGEVSGTPTASSTVFHFKVARAFTLKGSGHVADCETKPTDSVVFTIKKNVSGVVSNIGTITYGTANTVGTVAITGGSDTSFAVGNIITMDAPANLYSMVSPFFTFLGTCP